MHFSHLLCFCSECFLCPSFFHLYKLKFTKTYTAAGQLMKKLYNNVSMYMSDVDTHA